jgi:hypothetical protein
VTSEAARWVDPDAVYRSNLASTRLRVFTPARGLARHVPVAIVPLADFVRDPALVDYASPQAVVISKVAGNEVVERESELRRLVATLNGPALPAKLFADFTDNYAAFGARTGYAWLAEYQAGLAAACEVVVSCAGLAAELAPYARRGLHVIEDPWENLVQHAPRLAPADRVRLLWFGNVGPMNAEPLFEAIACCVEGLSGLPLHLDIVTAAGRQALVAGYAARLHEAHGDLSLEHRAWSPEATWAAIDACDIVLLPQDTEAAWSRGKSHNRLVEAIRGGRIAVASPIPSYVELREFAWVGDDLAAGVRWALDHPDDAISRVAAGQAALPARFAPGAVCRKWASVLGVPT